MWLSMAISNITQFTYGSGCPSCGTGVDKLTSITDPRGHTTIFQYDLAGRLVRETNPLGYFKAYTHDAAGNPITRTDENYNTTQYTYDTMNRLTQIRYPDNTTATFYYDGRNNMTSAGNANISYTFTYNLNDRLTNANNYYGKNLDYQYNAINQRTQMTVASPDGRTFTYGYDTGNRLSQIVASSRTYSFSYDNAGKRTGMTYPNSNGVTTTYTYNPSSYLTNILAQNLQLITINSFDYTHDAMGNRTSMTDLVGLHNFSYDDIYQLTQATHPNISTESFNYDATGNRTGTTVDDANALLEDSDFNYTYDFADNLIQKVRKSDNQTTVYTYDYENRLKRVQYPGMDAQYKYDAFGRRIEKNVNGQITNFLYDGRNIVTDFSGSWYTLKSKYVHSLAIDDPLSVEQGENIYYYHKDGLWSVTDLTDSTGNVVKTYDYTGFGEIHTQTGTVVQPFAFTSREYDLESGLYFYRGRYYDSKAGRFINRDPIGFVGGDVNLFRYVQNNPVNKLDPYGLKTWIYITGGGGGSLGPASAEGGTYYLIDPSNGKYYQFGYFSLGIGLGLGGALQMEAGTFEGPCDPKKVSNYTLTISAFAAAGKGYSSQITGTSFWGEGEIGLTGGLASGAGYGISGMVTYSWFIEEGVTLPGAARKIYDEYLRSHRK